MTIKCFVKRKWILYNEVPTEDREDAKSLDIRLDSLFTAMTNYEIVKIHDEIEAIQLLASISAPNLRFGILSIHYIEVGRAFAYDA